MTKSSTKGCTNMSDRERASAESGKTHTDSAGKGNKIKSLYVLLQF